MGIHLSVAVHGESKHGKTWFASTAPKPILLIDSEAGGMRFVPGKKVRWNPAKEHPPEWNEDWDICRVVALDYQTIQQTLAWLQTGKTPFRSVVLDSLTEFQGRYEKEIAPNLSEKVTYHHYRAMLRVLDDVVVRIRDISDLFGLDCAVFICGSDSESGTFRPLLVGKLRKILPYKVDIFGYIKMTLDEDGRKVPWLQITPTDQAAAGNRVAGLLPDFIPNPNLSEMIETIQKGME